MTGLASSQVIADFESAAAGTQNFGKFWGEALTAINQAADPTARTAGVLQLECNGGTGDGKAAFGIDPLPLGWGSADDMGAKFFTFDIYLPADFPDSAVIKIWAQIAEGSWQWTDIKYSVAGEGKHLQTAGRSSPRHAGGCAVRGLQPPGSQPQAGREYRHHRLLLARTDRRPFGAAGRQRLRCRARRNDPRHLRSVESRLNRLPQPVAP